MKLMALIILITGLLVAIALIKYDVYRQRYPKADPWTFFVP